MQPMVVDKRAARQAFARRLGIALSGAGIADDQFRRGWVSRTFGVSVESARKWLVGEAMPDTARIEGIARELGVAANWLLSGTEETQRTAIADPEGSYIVDRWQDQKSNSRLAMALDRAHRSGMLTPQLAAGLAALIESINDSPSPR